MEGVHLFGFWCPILRGGPQPTMIHVFDFPFEGPDAAVEVALKAFGSVRGIRKKKKTYVGNCAVFTGTRLVSLVIERAVLRFFQIDGYRCCIWYNWQPLVGNLCAQCRKCGQSGHSARQCTNACTSVGAPPPSQKRLFPLFFLFLFLLYPRMSPSRGAPPLTVPQMRTPLLTAQAVSLRTPGRSFFRLFLKVSISTMSLPPSWLLPRWWAPQVRAQRYLLMILMLVILTL